MEKQKPPVRKKQTVATEAEGPIPRLTIHLDSKGAWAMELSSVEELVGRIGEDTFAAFMKCFVGADRLLALQHLYRLNLAHTPEESGAHLRNWRVLVFSAAGTAHEIGEALQQLCGTKVVAKMADPDLWGPLNEIRKRWNTHPTLSKVRNKLAFHLGDHDSYRAGFAKAVADPPVILMGDDLLCGSDGEAVKLPWDILIAGIGLPTDPQMLKVMDSVFRDSLKFLDCLNGAFKQVLRYAQVEIVVPLPAETVPSVGLSASDLPSEDCHPE